MKNSAQGALDRRKNHYPAVWRDCARHILKAVAVVFVRFFHNPATFLDTAGN